MHLSSLATTRCLRQGFHYLHANTLWSQVAERASLMYASDIVRFSLIGTVQWNYFRASRPAQTFLVFVRLNTKRRSSGVHLGFVDLVVFSNCSTIDSYAYAVRQSEVEKEVVTPAVTSPTDHSPGTKTCAPPDSPFSCCRYPMALLPSLALFLLP